MDMNLFEGGHIQPSITMKYKTGRLRHLKCITPTLFGIHVFEKRENPHHRPSLEFVPVR